MHVSLKKWKQQDEVTGKTKWYERAWNRGSHRADRGAKTSDRKV